MSMSQKEYNYYLVIDNMHVLNLEYGAVTAICELAKVQTSILLSVKSLP
jgi:hypothetical protein